MENGFNPLEYYLLITGETMLAFSRKCGLSVGTIFRITNGGKPTIRTAKRLCRYSNGNLTLKDFGYE